MTLDSVMLENLANQLEKLPSDSGAELLRRLTSDVAQPEARAALVELMRCWRVEALNVIPPELAWAIRSGNATDSLQHKTILLRDHRNNNGVHAESHPAKIMQQRLHSSVPNMNFMIGLTASESVSYGDPDRAVKLLKSGWSAMEVSESRDISQNELSEILGISAATLVNWTSRSTKLTQIEAVLRILERLPTAMRDQLLCTFLRLFPTIESPQFAHLPVVVAQLRSLVKQRSGLTIIQGDESSRTFAFTALGHSILHAKPGPSRVRGIDTHAADWFVPVPGITYIAAHPGEARIREELTKVWSREGHGGWFMLNGALSTVPERRREILTLIQNQHVIIADDLEWQSSGLLRQGRETNMPIHIVEVAATDSRRISIELRTV